MSGGNYQQDFQRNTPIPQQPQVNMTAPQSPEFQVNTFVPQHEPQMSATIIQQNEPRGNMVLTQQYEPQMISTIPQQYEHQTSMTIQQQENTPIPMNVNDSRPEMQVHMNVSDSRPEMQVHPPLSPNAYQKFQESTPIPVNFNDSKPATQETHVHPPLSQYAYQEYQGNSMPINSQPINSIPINSHSIPINSIDYTNKSISPSPNYGQENSGQTMFVYTDPQYAQPQPQPQVIYSTPELYKMVGKMPGEVDHSIPPVERGLTGLTSLEQIMGMPVFHNGKPTWKFWFILAILFYISWYIFVPVVIVRSRSTYYYSTYNTGSNSNIGSNSNGASGCSNSVPSCSSTKYLCWTRSSSGCYSYYCSSTYSSTYCLY